MKKYDRFLRRAVVGPVASLAVPLSRSPMTWASSDRASAASVAAVLSIGQRPKERAMTAASVRREEGVARTCMIWKGVGL